MITFYNVSQALFWYDIPFSCIYDFSPSDDILIGNDKYRHWFKQWQRKVYNDVSWGMYEISDWQHVYLAALLLAWFIMFVFYYIQLVKQLHLFCLNTFLQSRALSVEFPEMMSEVIAAQLPKILAGMVKPLLFHKKWNVFSLIIEMISGSLFVCLFILVKILQRQDFSHTYPAYCFILVTYTSHLSLMYILWVPDSLTAKITTVIRNVL